MMSARKKWALGALVVVVNIVLLYGPLVLDTSYGGSSEHKLVFTSQFGTGIVKNPMGVAVNETTGNVYVGDFSNNRVDEFGPTGSFILTFGREVNETTGGNVCTQAEVEASGVKCKAGVAGEAAGQMNRPASVAIDQATGNVLVTDNANLRVDEFDGSGRFVLTIGGRVNRATGGNVCTQAEVEASGVECQKALPAAECQSTNLCSLEGAFAGWANFHGNSIAVGGPSDLLYVADKGRVQELTPSNGQSQGGLSVASISSTNRVGALTVDGAGDVYAFVEGVKGVHEFDTSHKEIADIDAGSESIFGLAGDSAGHIALVEQLATGTFMGSLYTSSGSFISNFAPPAGMGRTTGLAFDKANELYAADQGHQAIDTYKPVPAAELFTKPLDCTEGVPHETSKTLDCKLKGEVDAWGVPNTEAWFQWGTTSALGTETQPRQSIPNLGVEGEEEPKVPVESAAIEGLRPNETLYYRTAGTDKNDEGESPLTSATVSEATPMVDPVIVGEPRTLTVRPTSAVLSAELNPENAPTVYEFEYGACETLENCGSAQVTNGLGSSAYGNIGVTLEAKELRPETAYRYRLVAVNEKTTNEGRQVAGSEGSFTTPPEPVVTATTGPASDVTATTATLSGAVEPHGQPAVYTFELGLDNGAGTQYTPVLSGSVPANEGAVQETATVTGLQPGVRYLYRIVAENSYGSFEGLPMSLETASLSTGVVIPTVPQQLPQPPFEFPKLGGGGKGHPPACRHGFKRNKHGRCVKARRKTRTRAKHPKRKRR